MLRKIKSWFYDKFLPAWCREELLEDNARLQAKVQAQAREIRHLNAYIDGMENAMRRQSRVIIHCKEVSRQ